MVLEFVIMRAQVLTLIESHIEDFTVRTDRLPDVL